MESETKYFVEGSCEEGWRLSSGRRVTGWMIPDVSREVPESGLLGLLRSTALVAVMVGAVGSVGFMLRAGQRNDSRILLGIFALWVLSPFTILVLAHAVSKRWTALTRAALYSVMLFLTVVSLGMYGYIALGPARAKTAAVFVVVPPASCLVIAIVVPIAGLISGKLSRRGQGG